MDMFTNRNVKLTIKNILIKNETQIYKKSKCSILLSIYNKKLLLDKNSNYYLVG